MRAGQGPSAGRSPIERQEAHHGGLDTGFGVIAEAGDDIEQRVRLPGGIDEGRRGRAERLVVIPSQPDRTPQQACGIGVSPLDDITGQLAGELLGGGDDYPRRLLGGRGDARLFGNTFSE
jgi:hypothetical protein